MSMLFLFLHDLENLPFTHWMNFLVVVKIPVPLVLRIKKYFLIRSENVFPSDELMSLV